MILVLTASYCWTANVLGEIFKHLSVPFFRLDFDRYWDYKFLFSDNRFEIINSKSEILRSCDVDCVISYKAKLPIDEPFHADLKWVQRDIYAEPKGFSRRERKGHKAHAAQSTCLRSLTR